MKYLRNGSWFGVHHRVMNVHGTLASRGGGGVGGVITPGPEEAHKWLVYSFHDNAIGTQHIGGAPHQNYDPGPALALDGPDTGSWKSMKKT